jgi:hypothetical protein
MLSCSIHCLLLQVSGTLPENGPSRNPDVSILPVFTAVFAPFSTPFTLTKERPPFILLDCLDLEKSSRRDVHLYRRTYETVVFEPADFRGF